MISDKKLQEKLGWTPHKNQQLILDSVNKEEREIVICAGVRFGKSALCAYIALKVLLEDNRKIWIVAPTYDLTSKVFEYLVKWFVKVAPSQVNGISYKPVPTIRTARGSMVVCKSTENPAGLLGEELDLMIMDEAAQVPRKIWDEYLFARLSSRKGRSLFISTPFGKNWFYQKWLENKQRGSAFHFTSRDGVSIDEKEWEHAKERLPQHAFEMNYEAKFLEGAASVFRGINEITEENCLEDPKASHSYIMGVDLASVNDYTVCTVIDTFSHKVVHIERFNELEYPIQRGRIITLARKYNNCRIILDTTGTGKPVADDLRLENLLIEDFRFSMKSKQEMIRKLAVFIEQKAFTIPRNADLIDELEAYAYTTSEHGNVKYSAPGGQHDDMVISLGLAVWGLSNTEKDNPLRLKKEKKVRVAYEYL